MTYFHVNYHYLVVSNTNVFKKLSALSCRDKVYFFIKEMASIGFMDSSSTSLMYSFLTPAFITKMS